MPAGSSTKTVSQSRLPYNSQEGVNEEEDEVEGDHEEYGELSLHQLAQQAELEQECLPDQEEEPEDEAEMHYHLDPIGHRLITSIRHNSTVILTYPIIAKVM